MKKIVLIISLISFLTYSQTDYNKKFIGKWKVIKTKITNSKEDTPDSRELANFFLNSEINFLANGNFEITIKSKDDFASEFKEMVKDTKWFFDKKKNLLMIGNKADGYSIIGFEFIEKSNLTYLRLLETEINLNIIRL